MLSGSSALILFAGFLKPSSENLSKFYYHIESDFKILFEVFILSLIFNVKLIVGL
jgi:hypothetical protein